MRKTTKAEKTFSIDAILLNLANLNTLKNDIDKLRGEIIGMCEYKPTNTKAFMKILSDKLDTYKTMEEEEARIERRVANLVTPTEHKRYDELMSFFPTEIKEAKTIEQILNWHDLITNLLELEKSPVIRWLLVNLKTKAYNREKEIREGQ